jgi:SPP1 family predicted phage head-tail adaptor
MTTGLQLDPGEMRQRILFREKVETGDGAGGTTVTWQDWGERWSKARKASGDRRYETAQTDFPVDATFTVRRDDCAGVDEEMVIVWQGEAYEIQFIQDHGPAAMYMVIEGKSGTSQDALP